MSAPSPDFPRVSSIEAYHKHLGVDPPAFSELSVCANPSRSEIQPCRITFYQIQWFQSEETIFLQFNLPDQIIYPHIPGKQKTQYLNIQPAPLIELPDGYTRFGELPFFRPFAGPLKTPYIIDSTLSRAWRMMAQALMSPQKTYPQVVHTYLEPLLVAIHHAFLREQQVRFEGLASRGVLAKFEDIVERHLTGMRLGLTQDPINVQECADQLDMSRRELAALVRTQTEQTATTMINRIWIRQAELMLLQSSLRVKEIATHLGFKDPAYFTRLFTKLVGIPPKVYRAQKGI
ncbi:MAG: AraC family transcriptional regulator [Bacteroidota bacterium]